MELLGQSQDDQITTQQCDTFSWIIKNLFLTKNVDGQRKLHPTREITTHSS